MFRWFVFLPVIFGLVAGASLACQPGVNGFLAKRLHHPIQASVISFGTGFLILLVLSIAMGQFPPKVEGVWRDIPWWAWTGGLIGTFMVTTSLIFGPRIGAVGWLGLVMTGQMIGSVVLDHYGLIGYPQLRINPLRIGGVLLLCAGMSLIFLGSYRQTPESVLTSDDGSPEVAPAGGAEGR